MVKINKVPECQIGALPFALPKSAVYYRTTESELQRSKIQIANNLLIEYHNKENFHQYSNILKDPKIKYPVKKPNKKQPEREETINNFPNPS